MRFITLLPLTALACGLLLSACARKGAQSPESATEDPHAEDDDETGGMEMMQEFGGMNEEKVHKTIKRLYPKLSECLMKGFERVDFLGGEVAFLVKVNLSGEAIAAHAERSTLGDFDSELCMLQTLKASHWPKPVGGRIGLARTSIAFDPPSDVRPPVVWSYDDIRETVEPKRAEFQACGIGNDYSITVYVSTSGSVMTAGISHSDDDGEAAAGCVIETVKALTFPSPGSWPAKVTFTL